MLDVLLRFENLLENTEGPTDDTTWTTNVELPDDIFVGFNIGDMVELSLGGDRPIEDVINQFKWTKTEQNVSNYLQKTHQNSYNRIVTLFLLPFQKHPFSKNLDLKVSHSGAKSFSFDMDPMAIRTFKATMIKV